MKAHLEDHLRRLADDGLPAYVHDLAGLRHHVRTIREALPERVELFYAAKANPDPRLLRVLRDVVDGFEVASGGELRHVCEELPRARLAFGGPGKSAPELAQALDVGVERLHVESEHELQMLGALAAARPVEVLLRVNLPIGLGAVSLAMGGRPSPFGIDPTRLDACLRLLAAHPGIRLRGVHAHLASGLDAVAQLRIAEHVITWAVEWARSRGIRLHEVNIGGGMGVDYADPGRRFDWPAFGSGLRRILADHPGLRVRIEPGRSVSAYCGWYVTRVLDVKHSHGEAFAVLAGGTHHLRTPAAKGHDQPFEVVARDDWPWPWARPAVADEPVTLVGQLCTPKDVLARRAPVGRLRAGDRVAFAMAGAYAWNISHHDFLMHPAPGFHYLDTASPDSVPPDPVRPDSARPDCEAPPPTVHAQPSGGGHVARRRG
ncbi:type III PLP-dependent enzyme (plasmid) [Streptomyces sp. BHT-5-2]|uniref:type III PLP-dependent enzyme n=1 Tax=Streptomyces sp. BHT-5-2 TaxID=2866715 RepID=UPI001C8E113A|nr:type III PLP-dependent enzyme [Streptomyces sp. BHT-5-2]QZL07871.1 type III PLP-dependent enzyme [Streptomyces sp. BHT-5-2]